MAKEDTGGGTKGNLTGGSPKEGVNCGGLLGMVISGGEKSGVGVHGTGEALVPVTVRGLQMGGGCAGATGVLSGSEVHGTITGTGEYIVNPAKGVGSIGNIEGGGTTTEIGYRKVAHGKSIGA